MVDGRSQSDLFDRARSGDRVAFDDLQRNLEPSIRNYIVRLIGPSDREDEIAQDAFLSLYSNLAKVEEAAHLRPFLFRIVRNLCYDELRRQRRFDFVPIEEGSYSSPELSWILDQRLQDEEVHWIIAYSEVQKAMERLPELQRQSLILRYEQDLTYREIAEAMGTDTGTIKSRIHYGRSNLRKLLGPRLLRALGLKH